MTLLLWWRHAAAHRHTAESSEHIICSWTSENLNSILEKRVVGIFIEKEKLPSFYFSNVFKIQITRMPNSRTSCACTKHKNSTRQIIIRPLALISLWFNVEINFKRYFRQNHIVKLCWSCCLFVAPVASTSSNKVVLSVANDIFWVRANWFKHTKTPVALIFDVWL